MIFAEVSLEHLDDHVQVRFDRADVFRKVVIRLLQMPRCLLKLLASPVLRCQQLPHDACQSDEAVGQSVRLPRQLLKIPDELRLLLQQKLHRSLDLLRRHRVKFHEKPLDPFAQRHYRIVLRCLKKQSAGRSESDPKHLDRWRSSRACTRQAPDYFAGLGPEPPTTAG
jgi:hypothetical protein